MICRNTLKLSLSTDFTFGVFEMNLSDFGISRT